jgi:integrase
MECVRLRVKDVDFEQNQVTVREGKGLKDRVTMLPGGVKGPLAEHLKRVKLLHEQDLAAGQGRVYLPYALTIPIPSRTAENPKSSEEALQTKGITRSTPGTHGGCTGESPARHRRRGQDPADVTADEAGWISAADRKRRFEGVLWYQDMSRVPPDHPESGVGGELYSGGLW